MTLKDGVEFVPGMTVYWPYRAYETHDKPYWYLQEYSECQPDSRECVTDKYGSRIYHAGVYGSKATAINYIIGMIEAELDRVTAHLHTELDQWEAFRAKELCSG